MSEEKVLGRVMNRDEMKRTIWYEKKEDGKVTSRLMDILCEDRDGLSGIEFTGASVFDPADPFRGRVKDALAGKSAWSNAREDRAVGAMMGMVIGDAIGARVEFMPVRYGIETLRDMGPSVGGSFQLKPGQVSFRFVSFHISILHISPKFE